jgi:hypothetical protein
MPDELDDRAQDSYESLVAIADMAGGEWPERARAALVVLRLAAAESPKESQGVRLLRDINLFVERLAKMERIATHDFLAWLYEHGEQPYEDWWGESSGKKAARRLALALGEYDVKPVRWKVAGESFRGYETAPILSMVSLYAPNTTPNDAAPDLQDFSEDCNDAAQGSGVVLGSAANPHEYREASFGVVLNPKHAPLDLGTASLDEIAEQFRLDTGNDQVIE